MQSLLNLNSFNASVDKKIIVRIITYPLANLSTNLRRNHVCFRSRCKQALTARKLNKISGLVRPLSCSVVHHRKLVLGIETSFDDTGAAVVDDVGNVLGEALESQTKLHLEYGGAKPDIAMRIHKQNIGPVVDTALSAANIRLQDLDAVAVTTKPGLAPCLYVGLNYAKELVAKSGKPMIPIHHMEAHALTARMIHKVDFPFLVLLVSGGHALLTVAQGVEDFQLLGKTVDVAPGDALDKTSRCLNLKVLPECQGLSGGAAIERMARGGNHKAVTCPGITLQTPNCDFSFSGIGSFARRWIEAERLKHNLGEDDVIPNVSDFCASFQHSIMMHFLRRLQRGFLYCQQKGIVSEQPTLVVSGGVASNQIFRQGFEAVCQESGYHLVCPPPKLCTDNGIMIAWNGMEKLLNGTGIEPDPQAVKAIPTKALASCPIGQCVREELVACNIRLPKPKPLHNRLQSIYSNEKT
ncbi:probable tRNA N6-adenosine threonylcarbamoyltransferase, mitochondrial [Mizuhopecten yessoensis]|uniref:N(6)-L-threonylcarbamoyladenine synthase n=1 Tax=Mizuhopecten yessoensis TaxID=6573 RepID=A0A210PU35_MIZYE|nr:probable tRNA N6-adenosine threonylcarbamoyltransferase, mitochondrial [Mizuhopecten yessoensis]OWF40011.1 tRNA threonylcarbamoyladenosine biosynthesis protein Osgepl1 [Mizuhopecten yessoensis]